MIKILKLFISGIITTGVVLIFKFIQRKNINKYKKHKIAFDIIAGIALGFCAIYATEFGSVSINGAGLNVRDIAPISGGLYFGPIAGIIAGIIGGIERYLCPLWGGGAYTRYACSIACVFAGCLSSICYQFVFKKKRPKILQAAYVALTTEVFHMMLVLITNWNDTLNAFTVTSACSKPMIFGNTFAIILVTLGVKIIERKNLTQEERDEWHFRKKLKAKHGLSTIFQLGLFLILFTLFFVTIYFSDSINKSIAYKNADEILNTNLEDGLFAIEEIVDLSKIDTSGTYVLANEFQGWHVGSEGGFLVFNSDMLSITHDDYYNQSLSSLGIIPDGTISREAFDAIIFDNECRCLYAETNGYIVLVFYPYEEILMLTNISRLLTIYLELLVFAFIFVMVFIMLQRKVIKDVDVINAGLFAITQGKLDTKININGSKELEFLANNINTTVSALNKLKKESEMRMEKDLSLAKLIQSSACPKTYPAFPTKEDIDLYASMDTAKEVGGDFYDYYFVSENKVVILIADVSGKGIPAAMFMMRGKSIIKSLAERGLEANEVLKEANHILCEGNDAEMFITAWLGIIDLDTNKISYASAGHNPPLFKRKDGDFEYLTCKPGLVLAAMDGAPYKLYEQDFKRGDKIYLYTDGVTEANNKDEVLYGEARLLEVINSIKNFDAKNLCQYIKLDVDKFAGGREQFDDITMLCCGIKNDDYQMGIEKLYGEDSITVTATINNQKIITDFIERNFQDLDIDQKVINDINVAIDEIYSNIANHAYGTHAGLATVKVKVLQDPARIAITFIDSGIPFNPLEHSDPNTKLSAEEREIGGLGIYMVKKMMDHVYYEFKDNKNHFTIEKNIDR